MRCSACGSINKEGRKFCSSCGDQLTIVCTSCGATNEPSDAYCGECGSSLSKVPSSPPGERASRQRRVISVMFCDLVGFTPFSEKKDPEEVREALSSYFDEARTVVERYGGTIEKFIGDAVMAVWGAPIAHEDDAERAVRAALELVESVSVLGHSLGAEGLGIRGGVMTGEAAVDVSPDGEGMVAGDIVNTASRLQSAAAPGTVLVGGSTYLASNRSIAFEPAGDLGLKGKEGVVQAWRPLRVIAGAQGRSRSDALEPPFVGRENEFRAIKTHLEDVAREGRPRLVSVVGVPGVGKSRLAWEFFKWIDGVTETYLWHQGRCPSYGDGITFWALSEMVRMRAQISEQDDEASVRMKLSAVLDEYRFELSERPDIEAALLTLLGVEGSADVDKGSLFPPWRVFFERLAEQDPVVLLFEDIQWADQGLLDFLEHVLEWARSSPILIITLARPEIVDSRPTWGAGQRNFASMYLEPLSVASMRQLLGGIVDDLPPEVSDRIIARAEGIPLYAVETLRTLVDKGKLVRREGRIVVDAAITDLEVPDNLHSLLASRLDALDPGDRSLVQQASVLGKTFTVEALVEVSDADVDTIPQRLMSLVRREILSYNDDPRSPEREQYGFVQDLLREVAYQTLSRKERLRLHVSAAGHFSAQGDDLASVVASHYSDAYRLATDEEQAGELRAKANATLTEAGRRAASLGSHDQALSYFMKAAELSDDEHQRAHLRQQACVAARHADRLDEAVEIGILALRHFEEIDDGPDALVTASMVAEVMGDSGRAPEAVEILMDSLNKPGRFELREAAAAASILAPAYFWAGDKEQSLIWVDKALELAEKFEDDRTMVETVFLKSAHKLQTGAITEATTYLWGVVATANEMGFAVQALRAYTNLSFIKLRVDPRVAFAIGKEGISIARREADRVSELAILGNAIEAAISVGDWAWCTDVLAETIGKDLLHATGQGLWLEAVKLQGVVLAGYRGEVDEAALFLEQGTTVEGDPQAASEWNSAHGHVSFAAGRYDDAISRMRAALEGEWGYSLTRINLFLTLAALTDDLASAEDAMRQISERRIPGEYQITHSILAEAIIAGLRGDLAASEGHFDNVAARRRANGWRFDLALGQMAAAALLGPTSDAGRKAVDEAGRFFDEVGAVSLRRRLAEIPGAASSASDRER